MLPFFRQRKIVLGMLDEFLLVSLERRPVVCFVPLAVIGQDANELLTIDGDGEIDLRASE